MSHITVIDQSQGTNQQGYCIRIGPALPNRLAGCLRLIKTAGAPLATYSSIGAACDDAIAYRNAHYPSWRVRIDCTIA